MRSTLSRAALGLSTCAGLLAGLSAAQAQSAYTHLSWPVFSTAARHAASSAHAPARPSRPARHSIGSLQSPVIYARCGDCAPALIYGVGF